jgi:hypothetical protein
VPGQEPAAGTEIIGLEFTTPDLVFPLQPLAEREDTSWPE